MTSSEEFYVDGGSENIFLFLKVVNGEIRNKYRLFNY